MFLNTWFASNVLLAALILQLIRWQVYFELPFFTACCAFRLVQALALSLTLGWFQFLSNAYLITWFVTESIAIVLVALASAECYVWLTQRIFRLGRIGAVALAVAMVVGAAVMIGTRLDSAEDLSRNLAYQLRFKQFIMGFLAVSLAILLGFYRRFPLYVPQQAWPHGIVQLTYLAAHALGYGMINAGGTASTANINEFLSIDWVVSLAAWLWIFRKGITWQPAAGADGDLRRADQQARRLERML